MVKYNLRKDKYNYINAFWQKSDSNEIINVYNPSDGSVLGEIINSTYTDVDLAIKAAKDALIGWERSSKEYRINYLEKFLKEYEKRIKEIGFIISLELGYPLKDVEKDQADMINQILTNLHILKEFEFENKNKNHTKIYEPYGVCGLITPWNYPIYTILRKLIFALGAGCTVILKPAELTPFSALIIAEIIDEIKLPKGVFNLINGYGKDCGNYLSQHKDIDLISFTGSIEVGKKIITNSANSIKKVILELGGKSPLILCNDMDFKNIPKIAKNFLLNTSQVCTVKSRIYVDQRIYSRVVKQFKKEFNKSILDKFNKNPTIGPLISQLQKNKVTDFIKSAEKEGAKVWQSSVNVPTDGYFVRPTIITNLNNKMRVVQKEIFGPVLCIIPFKTIDEALEFANDSEYGLSASVQTNDLVLAKSISRNLQAGTITINNSHTNRNNPKMGFKQSGLGYENGLEGLLEYLKIKVIYW
ncbi:Aldehyde dehydrogenase family [seawater metagenome]|uniref:Aldehyde dehydrogenase family n=1 Tax=seawater metagenome TaxID=1561972 RepID=A0A5E8CH75_9ZZZZ